MPRLIEQATVIQAAGNKPKRIEEYAGQVNSGHRQVSVARMVSPSGWQEPGQRPEFEEITVVLRGVLRVEYEGGMLEVAPGQGFALACGEASSRSRQRTVRAMPSATIPPPEALQRGTFHVGAE
jgi:hypothetical protein